MHKRQGFIMFEALMYFFLVSLTTITFFNWIVKIHSAISKSNKENSYKIEQLIAYDIVTRDIRQAPSCTKEWKKIEPHEIIWHQNNNQDIGLLCEKNCLYRLEGKYSTKTNSWLHRTKSLVLQSAHGTFTAAIKKIGKQEYVDHITWNCLSLPHTVILANRVLE